MASFFNIGPDQVSPFFGLSSLIQISEKPTPNPFKAPLVNPVDGFVVKDKAELHSEG
jgi:hypothetical protein